MREEFIKTEIGKPIGVIRTDSNGDQTAFAYPTYRILGYYKARYNQTTDPIGRIVGQGNSVVAFIYEDYNKNH